MVRVSKTKKPPKKSILEQTGCCCAQRSDRACAGHFSDGLQLGISLLHRRKCDVCICLQFVFSLCRSKREPSRTALAQQMGAHS
jgi:hypothetical protein